MSEDYDQVIAAHYAAYRPPLHSIILGRATHGMGRFARGLDVGCGTGRSSIALAECCDEVMGIDPSRAMIEQAIPHRAVTYRQCAAEQVPVDRPAFDLVTFAGSLSYVDLERTALELRRVCNPQAIVVPYDFEVRLETWLSALGIETLSVASSYQHAINFTGVLGFKELLVKRESLRFSLSPSELAHVLLSDALRHRALAARFKTNMPHGQLVQELDSGNIEPSLHADIYYAVYLIDLPS